MKNVLQHLDFVAHRDDFEHAPPNRAARVSERSWLQLCRLVGQADSLPPAFSRRPGRAALLVVLAACLGTVGCSLRAAHNVPVAAAPPPQPTLTSAPEEPVSIAQTNVYLPKAQPVQADAVAAPPPELPPAPEPLNQTAKPRNAAAPKPAPRQETGVQTVQGPAPPPTTSRRRYRPVESAAERHRMLTEIANRQRQVQDFLAKAKTRQLSDAEKGAAERIQSFLEQTEAALKDQDLQQAEALSNRALLLCPELNLGK
jgi:hypothetical protein